MPPQEGQSSLQEPNAASSAEFLDGMKKATIREAKKGKKSTRYNSYENNNAWKFHMMRLKKLREEKQRREHEAMTKIANDINHEHISKEILELWIDYEHQKSPEAHVAKNLDKYEMIVQADEYEREQNKVLQSFFDSTKDSFTHPEVHAWANVLWNERDKRLGNV